jgi:hypothetical protein
MPDGNDAQWLKQHVEFLGETEWQKGQFWIAVVVLLAATIMVVQLLDGNLAVAGVYGNWALSALIFGALRREHRRREVLQRRCFRLLCRQTGITDEELREIGLSDSPDDGSPSE